MNKASGHTINGQITISNHTVSDTGSWTSGKNVNSSMINTDAQDPVKVMKEFIKAGVFTVEELVAYYRHTRISNALSGKGVYLASTNQEVIDRLVAEVEIEKMIESE
jgi:hypothetical protein